MGINLLNIELRHIRNIIYIMWFFLGYNLAIAMEIIVWITWTYRLNTVLALPQSPSSWIGRLLLTNQLNFCKCTETMSAQCISTHHKVNIIVYRSVNSLLHCLTLMYRRTIYKCADSVMVFLKWKENVLAPIWNFVQCLQLESHFCNGLVWARKTMRLMDRKWLKLHTS